LGSTPHDTKIKLGVYGSALPDFGRDEASDRKSAAADSKKLKMFGNQSLESSCTIRVGGESLIVGELSSVACFELEAYSEPKALFKDDLEHLFPEEVTIGAIAERCGLSWSAIQERLRPTRRWDAKKKKFLKFKSQKL
jgi:hypothetical protein